jgi:hypothetical protein
MRAHISSMYACRKTATSRQSLKPIGGEVMNLKLVELMELFPEMIRCSIIVAGGMAAFFLFASSPALAKERGGHEKSALVLMKPSDLPNSVRTAGDDMYLYEGNAKTYLYIEQDGGKHLVVLDVTKPEKVSVAGERQLAVDVPYDFVGPLGGDSVLIHFRTRNGRAPEWGRLSLNKPASPALVTWTQTIGDIIDPLDGHIITATGPWMSAEEARLPNPYQVVDVQQNEAFTLATIPGVKKVLTDTTDGRRFYLAGDGLWVLRNLAAETKLREEQAQPI